MFNPHVFSYLNRVVTNYYASVLENNAIGSIIWVIEYGHEFFLNVYPGVQFESRANKDFTDQVIHIKDADIQDGDWLKYNESILKALRVKQREYDASTYEYDTVRDQDEEYTKYGGKDGTNLLNHAVAINKISSYVHSDVDSDYSSAATPRLSNASAYSNSSSRNMIVNHPSPSQPRIASLGDFPILPSARRNLNGNKTKNDKEVEKSKDKSKEEKKMNKGKEKEKKKISI